MMASATVKTPYFYSPSRRALSPNRLEPDRFFYPGKIVYGKHFRRRRVDIPKKIQQVLEVPVDNINPFLRQGQITPRSMLRVHAFPLVSFRFPVSQISCHNDWIIQVQIFGPQRIDLFDRLPDCFLTECCR